MDFVVQRHDGSVSDNSGLGKCRLELVIAVLQERRLSDISRSRLGRDGRNDQEESFRLCSRAA